LDGVSAHDKVCTYTGQYNTDTSMSPVLLELLNSDLSDLDRSATVTGVS